MGFAGKGGKRLEPSIKQTSNNVRNQRGRPRTWKTGKRPHSKKSIRKNAPGKPVKWEKHGDRAWGGRVRDQRGISTCLGANLFAGGKKGGKRKKTDGACICEISEEESHPRSFGKWKKGSW